MTKRFLKKGGSKAVNKKQKPIRKLFDLEAKHLSDGSGEDEDDALEDDEYDETDSFINNDDEEASASSPQSVKVFKKPIKIVKAAASLKKGSPIVDKLPGDSSYPLSSWSVTITKTKDDVSIHVLEIMHDFVKAYCTRGAMATEVGPRAHNFHVQGVMTLYYPTTAPFKKALSKYIDLFINLIITFVFIIF